MIVPCIVETNMDEKNPKASPTQRPDQQPQKQPRIPTPPRWQDMIYPERRHDPYRWLRH